MNIFYICVCARARVKLEKFVLSMSIKENCRREKYIEERKTRDLFENRDAK